MGDREDGGQAFPSEGEGHGSPKYHSPGMSLRDWFAGQALVGLLSGPDNDWTNPHEVFANEAYKLADVMMKERKK